jgi:hypothetical protein
MAACELCTAFELSETGAGLAGINPVQKNRCREIKTALAGQLRIARTGVKLAPKDQYESRKKGLTVLSKRELILCRWLNALGDNSVSDAQAIDYAQQILNSLETESPGKC